MNQRAHQIGAQLHDLINQVIFFEKKKVFKHGEVTLYPSEIHLVLAVAEKPRNASQLAEMLQVTLGAISQTISRLVKKGVLIKQKDTSSNNELKLSFTPLGESVLTEISERFTGQGEEITAYLEGCDERQLESISGFLSRVSDFFSKLE